MIETKIKDVFKNELHLYIWDDVSEPKGVIQIVHGVNEHGLRYDSFSRKLNEIGYIVYCHDQFSQGKSKENLDEPVYFGKDGVLTLKNGVVTVYNEIKKDYDNLNIFAIGHSLGASVLRSILIDNKIKYQSVVLSGTGLSSTKGMGLIITYGNILKIFKAKKPSKFFDNIFRQTQLKLNEKTKINHFIEWLTRDKEQNEIDKNDRYLFIRLSVSAFVDILKLFKHVNNKRKISYMSKENNILLLSGTHDPATNFGNDTKKLNDLYTNININSQLILYNEGRHDSLQEINRGEVYSDIIEFLNKY